MNYFEQEYVNLIDEILSIGETIHGRNGRAKKVFGRTLTIDMTGRDSFPLLNTRKIFYKGVLGELAAFFRGPKHISDFEKWGCNYWKDWAKPDGSIEVDYGNAWFEDGQFDHVVNSLKNNPNDRRMIINGWRPNRLLALDLPCCHFMYQWSVRDQDTLDMIWYQRSADTMIGLPSDIVLAAAWNVLLANQVGLQPGRITMMLGDTHIYEEHFEGAEEFIKNFNMYDRGYPLYELIAPPGMDIRMFEPSMLQIKNYEPRNVMKFEIKA